MDITSSLVAIRERSLTYGADYAVYQTQLASRLHNCRKKLKVATKHRAKFNPKTSRITPELVAEDPTFVRLQLLTAERAYSHAMAMKASARSDGKPITGRTRSHIASRLNKAAQYAETLSQVLKETPTATPVDRLEARAYAALLRAAAYFEKQNWLPCVANYAAAWAIYSALASPSSSSPSALASADTFRQLVTESVEPPLRYAAYQLNMPRSKPIPIIAREALTSDAGAELVTGSESAADTESLVAQINAIDSNVLLPDESALDVSGSATAAAVASTRTLVWRNREVRIEDASIASAWAALDLAKARLESKLALGGGSDGGASPRDRAAAYDEVLEVSQDAVDATKAAIDDLRAEGLPQSDPSVQVLYIARTAANYEMISYRIGRNRVLTGEHDGATVRQAEAVVKKARGRGKKGNGGATGLAKPEAPGRFIARLKEKVVLYDGTLQSLESVKELPGVAADEGLSQQLDATVQYFVALKSLAIARSYNVAGNTTSALALVKHGLDQATTAAPSLKKANEASSPADSEASESPLLTIRVSAADAQFLLALLQSELQRFRALVDIEKIQAAGSAKNSNSNTAGTSSAPALSHSLGVYPRSGAVDLDNIVTYPPRTELVPVKPIFLDVAWNYIDYPSKSIAAAKAAAAASSKASPAGGKAEAEQPQKRGWFGFGR